MKIKRIVALLFCALVGISAAPTTEAASASEELTPDFIFYRSKVTDTFEGEIDIQSGRDDKVSNVSIKEGEDPSFFIYDHDNHCAYFDSLFRSGEQTLEITRGERTYEKAVDFAVYDHVTLEKAFGSVTLTVKDNRTLNAVSGAKYALYQNGKKLKEELISDSDGKITVKELEAGTYELRQITPSTGYKETTKSVSFTIGGLDLSGGDSLVRTTSGKKIRADSNETLIAGQYSPDIEIVAEKEDQIQTVSVLYRNYGATLEKPGEDLQKTYPTALSAEKAINQAKADGLICGPIEISYTLTGREGRSTCNYIQYMEKEIVTPTPVPTPIPTPTAIPTPQPNYNSGSNNGVTVSPTIAPTPAATPIAEGTLTIMASTDSGQTSDYAFSVIGVTTAGASFEQTYKTDEAGEIVRTIPNGTYTVSLKENSRSNEGIEIPEPQTVTIASGKSAFLTFSLTVTERDLTITVVDDDGVPLEGVLVGIFDPLAFEQSEPHLVTSNKTNSTDINQQLLQKKKDAEKAERLEDPYNRKNAVETAFTNENGMVVFSRMPTSDLQAAVITAPDGYAVSKDSLPIAAGWDDEYMLLCQYVRTEVAVTGEATGKPVLGAKAILKDQDGEKLTEWEITEKSHELIRVPAGQYGLTVSYGNEEESFTFEVTNEDANQTVSLVSKLSGNVEVAAPPTEQEEQGGIKQILLITLIGVILIAISAVGIFFWKKRRKRTGGYQ